MKPLAMVVSVLRPAPARIPSYGFLCRDARRDEFENIKNRLSLRVAEQRRNVGPLFDPSAVLSLWIFGHY
jgi:hypothetical protein